MIGFSRLWNWLSVDSDPPVEPRGKGAESSTEDDEQEINITVDQFTIEIENE